MGQTASAFETNYSTVFEKKADPNGKVNENRKPYKNKASKTILMGFLSMPDMLYA